VLALKNRVCPEFTVLNTYFYHSEFRTTCDCPEKQEFVLKISTALKYFLSFRILEELALALKTEFVMNFFTVFNILFTFRMFEQLFLALKKSVS